MRNGDDEAGIGMSLGKLQRVQIRRYRACPSPEQPQRLVDEMAAQIAQQSTVGSGFQGLWLIEVETWVETPDVTQQAAVEHVTEGSDVGVPAPVVEDAQQDARCIGFLDEFTTSLRRCRDRHRLDACIEKLAQRSEHRHSRQVLLDLRYAGRCPRDHADQFTSVGRHDERSVRSAWKGSVSGKDDVELTADLVHRRERRGDRRRRV
jgi:hypothetical protein